MRPLTTVVRQFPHGTLEMSPAPTAAPTMLVCTFENGEITLTPGLWQALLQARRTKGSMLDREETLSVAAANGGDNGH